MKILRVVTATTVLVGSVLIAPVVSVGARAHAVPPDVQSIAFDEGRVPPGGSQRESVLTRDSEGVDVVGVTFPDRASAQTVTVEVRSMSDGAWSPWTEIGLSDSAPDPGTPEASRASLATEPVGVTGSDRVQLRLRAAATASGLNRLRATFVDGGESAADRGIGRTPAASAAASAAQPTIISRAAWGADESIRTCTPDQVETIAGAVVHHTVSSNTYAADEVPALLRGIYAYHVTSNGWCDVGYNFFVDRFGRLFEGRSGGIYANVVGAQAAGFNSQTVGISSLANHDSGTFGAVAPSTQTLTAIGALIGWKGWLNGWDPATTASFTSAGNSKYVAGTTVTKPRVSGHQDFNQTECPGDLTVSQLDTARTTAASTFQAGVEDAVSETTAAAVVETYSRPSGTSFAISGRGYGHGRGMSQYGAYGAALKGLSRDQILAFYYPGTTLSTNIGNPTVRVRLTALGSGPTQVVAQPNLVLSDGTRTASLYATNADGTLRERWRLAPDGTGLTLQWLEKGVWRSTSSWKAMTKPLSFSDSKLGKVRVVMPDGTQRDYRRTVRSLRYGTGVMTLSVVSMNYYLQGVVPNEMSPSWPTAALQAQAVAARSYARYEMAHQAAGTPYDVCDSTMCQVYRGLAGYTANGTLVPHENTLTTAAVAATSGLGVFHNGAAAFTQFGSSNGGRTVASSLPYQVSKSDPYDAIPAGSTSRWSTNLSISRIEKAYPTTGALRALRIDKRDGIDVWGGRIASITVVGAAGSKTVTGDAFASAMGLRSSWWTVTSAPATSAASFPKDLDGNERADLLAVDPQGQLQLLSGSGSSTFTAKVMAPGWARVGLVANVGAWDGDNRHDVVERDAGTLYYHPGDGAGGFFPRKAISAGWDTIDLVMGSGDMDGDGLTDFVVRTTSGQLKVYRGNGRGGVISTILIGSGWRAYRSIVVPGDLTGDQKPDVLAIRASDDAMLLFPGTGTGRVGAGVPVAGTWSGYSALMASGDVTGDARDDVVARRSVDGALVVHPGNDMGRLGSALAVAGTQTWGSWTRWAP